jgi:hypothetical protein
MIIGTRYIYDGETYTSGYGEDFAAYFKVNKRIKVLLVVMNSVHNPVYVPIDLHLDQLTKHGGILEHVKIVGSKELPVT